MMEEVDKFKEIFDFHPELDDLFKTRESLRGKRCRTTEEKKELVGTKQRLKKIFKKIEKELVKFPLNVDMSMMTAREKNIDIKNYELNNGSLLIYVGSVEDIWATIGTLLNILYNNILNRIDNGIEKISVFLKDIVDSKILTMSVKDIVDFMERRISVNEFSKKCRVV